MPKNNLLLVSLVFMVGLVFGGGLYLLSGSDGSQSDGGEVAASPDDQSNSRAGATTSITSVNNISDESADGSRTPNPKDVADSPDPGKPVMVPDAKTETPAEVIEIPKFPEPDAEDTIKFSVTISGRVVDSSDIGIEGAKVAVANTRVLGTKVDESLKRLDMVPTNPDFIKGVGQTAPDGFFKLEAKGVVPESAKGVQLKLGVSLDGYAKGKSSWFSVENCGQVRELKIILHRQTTVSGRVVDSAGNGVAGAKVTVAENWTNMGLGGKMTVPGNATQAGDDAGTLSGEDGSFLLQVAVTDEGREIQLDAVLKGFAEGQSESLEIKPEEHLQDVEITLYRPGVIFGKVVDADGNPAEGANVNVYSQYGDYDYSTTGADGKFRFENVVPGNYNIIATRDELDGPHVVGNDPRASNQVTIAEGQEHGPVILTLPLLARLIFRLAQPAGGAVNVSLKGDDGGGWWRQYSGETVEPDENGVYRLAGLTTEHTRVEIKAEGFAKTTFDIAPVKDQDLDLRTLTLNAGATLRGRAVDRTGLGVGGAAAEVTGDQNSMMKILMRWNKEDSDPEYVTAADGNFEFAGLADGTHTLIVKHEDFASAKVSFSVTDSQDPEPITVELTEGGTVAGHVAVGSTPTGSALVVAVVLVEAGSLILQWISMAPMVEMDYISELKGEVDSNGDYTVEKVPPGDYVALALRSDDESPARKDDVKVIDGETTRVDFDVGSGGTVYGAVVRSDGLALAGEKVWLSTGTGMMAMRGDKYSATTDESGQYRIDNVPAGTYVLFLERDGLRVDPRFISERTVEVPVDGEVEMNVDLSRTLGTTIRGKVTKDGAKTFRNYALLDPSGKYPIRYGDLGDDGIFEIPSVLPGRYYLWFGVQKSPVRELVVVRPNTPEIVIERHYLGASLSGRVTVSGAADADLSDIEVLITSDIDEPFGEDAILSFSNDDDSCDSEGKYSFDRLVIGSYRITATAKDYAPTTRTIELRPGEQTLDLIISGEAARIEIYVLSIKGGETAGPTSSIPMLGSMMMVNLFSGDGERISLPEHKAMTPYEVGTTHTLTSLAPGDYRLELSGIGVEPYTAEVIAAAGEIAKVSVELHRAATLNLKVQNQELQPIEIQGATIDLFDVSGNPVTVGGGMANAFAGMMGGANAKSRTLKVTPLVAGTYRVVVTLEGYQPWETTVEVPRSTVVEIEVTLQ